MQRTSNKAIIGWTFATAGFVLLYAAIKGVSPSEVVTGLRTGIAPTGSLAKYGQTASSRTTGAVAPSGSGGSTGSDTVETSVKGVERANLLKARTVKPDLVVVTFNGMRLDREAAASFKNVERRFGRSIPLVGAYRSAAQQQEGYDRSPGTHAKPGKSLHEVGIALDVSDAIGNRNAATLVAAFEANGWFRRGKVINGKPEEWHWSWMVPG
jgi:hypothetical protein